MVSTPSVLDVNRRPKMRNLASSVENSVELFAQNEKLTGQIAQQNVVTYGGQIGLNAALP